MNPRRDREKTARRISCPGDQAATDVAISCRVRLARNLASHRFPDKAGDKEREAIFDELEPIVAGLPMFRGGSSIRIDEIDDTGLDELVESRMISRDLAEGGAGAGAVFSADQFLSVMFNEEDHLRIQAILPFMDLKSAWKLADGADSAIEHSVRYAFDSQLGYITACPSNLGTGLRASVMLHLPGLRLAGHIDAVYRAFDSLRVETRGMGGEGSNFSGDLVQISNQGTLGVDENHVISELSRIADDAIRQERNARARLLLESPAVALDFVARSLALLQNARMIGTDESLDLLSALRVGIDWGMLSGISPGTVKGLALEVQPGHMTRMFGKSVEDPVSRDIERASWLRRRLAKARVEE